MIRQLSMKSMNFLDLLQSGRKGLQLPCSPRPEGQAPNKGGWHARHP